MHAATFWPGRVMLITSLVAASTMLGIWDASPHPVIGEEIVLENDFVRYTIAPDGQNLSFFDKAGQREQLLVGQKSYMTVLRINGRTIIPQRCTQEGNTVTIEFDQARVSLEVSVRPTHFKFRITSFQGVADAVQLFNLPLRPGKYTSGIAGIVQDESFAVAVRSLNLKTLGQVSSVAIPPDAGNPGSPEKAGSPLRGGYVSAVAYREHGLDGAATALVACPSQHLREALQQMLEAENALRSSLGGPWALDAPQTRGSYVFATVSEENVNAWIELAQKAGIAQIHLIGWEQTLGHYQPRKDFFPHGIEGLRQVIEKIHAAGLRAGMHTLTGCISPSDPWVTPQPDPRLAVDARFTLVEPLDETTDRIVVQERPGDLDTVWAYGGRGNVLRVGHELIQYTGLAQEPPYGFTGCKRGAFGTRPQSHAPGAAVEHLFVRYGCFLPDENSTLVDEIAQAIASVYNTCQFDMIYMDGAEGMPGGWYGISRMREAIFRRLNRPALVEASCWDYHSWVFHSRLGAWDHPNWGLKPFVDWHCRSNEEYRRSTLLPTQLGWWAILGSSRDHDAELPDEFEYLCVKSLAFGMPLSFQGIAPGPNPPCARQSEYLEMLSHYERLRLSEEVPQSIREQLKKEGQDFHLEIHPDGAWSFRPVDYIPQKVTAAVAESMTWSVHNKYPSQPLRVRIQALYGVEPYDAPEAMEILSFESPKEFSDRSQAANVAPEFAIVRDDVRPGDRSGQLTVSNTGNTPQGAWARLSKRFDPPINFGERGALGLWIRGDKSGAILNLQLSNPLYYWPTCDEHYVHLDFDGWRYVELLLRERDADEFHRYVWPYGSYYAVVYRSPLIRDHVSELNVYVNNVPAGGKTTCLLSPVRVLPIVAIKIAAPTLEANGRRVTFPVVLASGQYLEFDGAGPVRIYDERGALIGTTAPEGEIPELKSGVNQLHFSCSVETPPRVNFRARVTVITQGDPLGP